MANFYHDRKKPPKKKEESWFQKTIAAAVTLTGTAGIVYGAFRLKGPVGKLLEHYSDARMNNYFNKALSRYEGVDLDDLMEKYKSAIRKTSDITLGGFNTPIDDNIWNAMKPSENITKAIKRMEYTIAERFDSYFGVIEAQFRQSILGNTSLTLNKASNDQHLAKLRHDVLVEFLGRYGYGSAEKLAEMEARSSFYDSDEYYKSITEKKEFIENTTKDHEHYLSTDQRYAKLYYNRLKAIEHRARMFMIDKSQFRIEKTKSIDQSKFTRALYGNLGDAITRRNMIVPAPVTEHLYHDNKLYADKVAALTSAGHSWKPSGDAQLDLLGKIDYAPFVKQIINRLKRAVKEDILVNFNISVESHMTDSGEVRYLITEMFYSSQPNRPSRIKIPLATEGLLPSSTPSLQLKIGDWIKVPDIHGKKGNPALMHASQYMLHEFARALDTSLLSGVGAGRTDPSQFESRVRSIIGRLMDELAPFKGSERDIHRLFSVRDRLINSLALPSTNESARIRRNLWNYSTNIAHMQTMKKRLREGRKVMVINIDLESLAEVTTGPEWSVYHRTTQFVKAGITAVEMTKNGSIVREAEEIASKHGYNYFSQRGVTAKVIENLKSFVLPDGDKVKPENAMKEYKEYLDKIGAVDYGDNRGFFRALAQTIKQLRQKYEGEYEIVYATKNGSEFDLPAMGQYMDQGMVNHIKKHHIDIQATANILGKAYMDSSSLKQERLLQALLRRLGHKTLSEFQLKSPRQAERLQRIIRALQKGKVNKSGELFSLLSMDEAITKRLTEKGWITKFHISPVLDSLIASALFAEQFSDFIDDESVYTNIDSTIKKYLKTHSAIRSSQNILDVMLDLEGQAFPGLGVASASALTQGMPHKMMASLIHLSDMLVFPDVRLNKSVTQRYATADVFMPSRHWFNMYGSNITDPKTKLEFNKRFNDILSTDFHRKVGKHMLPKAGDAQAVMTKTVMMKVFYNLNPHRWGDDAGRIFVTDNWLRLFTIPVRQHIPVEDLVRSDPVQLNDKINRFYEATIKKLEELKGVGNVSRATREEWLAAQKLVAASGDWTVNFESAVIGASKSGGNIRVTRRKVGGKLVGVIHEQDSNGVPRLIATIASEISGTEAGKLGYQLRITGAKAIMLTAKTLSDGMAYGVPMGFDAHAAGDFFVKGEIGATKEVMLRGVLYEAYERLAHLKGKEYDKLKAVIDKMAQKMNATADPNSYQFTKHVSEDISGRARLTGGKESRIKAFNRYIGNIDVRLSDIINFAKDTGMVWSKKDIIEYQNSKPLQSAYATVRRIIGERLKTLHKQIREGSKALEGLEKDPIAARMAIEELRALHSLLNPTLGGAKLIIPIWDAPEPGSGSQSKTVSLGLMSWDAAGIYGTESTHGIMNARFRSDYLLALHNSEEYVPKYAIDYIKRHAFVHRGDQYASALKTWQNMKNAWINGALIKGPINMNQLRDILETSNELGRRSIKFRMKSAESYRAAIEKGKTVVQAAIEEAKELKDIADELQSTRTVAHLNAVQDELHDLTSTTGARFLAKLRRSKRFTDQISAEYWSNLAKEHGGVIAIEMPTHNGRVFELDLVQDLKLLGGKILGAPELNEETIAKRGETIKNFFDVLYKEALKKKQESKDNKKLLFEYEDGKLKLNTFIIDMDPHLDNNFNRLGPDILFRSSEMGIKMEVLGALQKYHEALVNQRGIEEATINLKREMLTYMLIGMEATKNTNLWLAGQYEPPGLMKRHAGIEQIKLNAMELLRDITKGRKSIAALGLASEHRATSYLKVLNNLINADIHTVAITESMFKEAPYLGTNGVSFDGTSVRYAQYLEESLKREGPGGGAIWDEIRTGQRYLPGGIMYRFPVTTNGQHALMGTQYLIVPDEIGEIIGMNANTFFVSKFYSSLIGADSDGDRGILHFTEIGSIKEMYDKLQAGRDIIKKLGRTPEFQTIIKGGRISRDSQGRITKSIKLGLANQFIGFTSNGKAAITSYDYDKNGNLVCQFHTVDSELLDLTDAADQIEALARGSARHTPHYALKEGYIGEELLKAAMPAFTKQLIPTATNLLKKRTFQLIAAGEAGMIPGGARTIQDIIGTINHGLTGTIGQVPIDMTKHVEPSKLAKAIKTISYFIDPNKYKDYYDVAKETFLAQYKEWDGAPNQETLESYFNYASEAFKIYDRMTRTHQDFRMYNDAILNASLGKRNASQWDLMRAQFSFEFTSMAGDVEKSPVAEFLNAIKVHPKYAEHAAIFRKGGKFAAFGAAALMGLSFFRPFGNSTSINPADAFIDLGPDVDGRNRLFTDNLELPRSIPLDTVNPSFSMEAFIKLNDDKSYNNRKQARILASMLKTASTLQPSDLYEFRGLTNMAYSNYTMSIPYMGTSDLSRRFQR